MQVFFGRINEKQNPTDQFTKGYYHAKKGTSYFGKLNNFGPTIKESVYVFMIATNSIELWKVSQWGKNQQELLFTKTGVDLDNMSRAWFAAFKFFYLDLDLIIFTTRRPYKKAFFKLRIDDMFTEAMLLNPASYSNYDNYRNIELCNTIPSSISRNPVFYKVGEDWKFKSPEFFDNSVSSQFRDNTKNIGRGRPNKDSLLRYISEATPLPKEFTPDELSLLNIYDIFFCDYNGNIEDEILLNPDENCYKISMSPKDIDEDSFTEMIEQNVITIHKNTPSKGASYESQGLTFSEKIKIDDYFYLCRGNSKLILLGRITSKSEPSFIEEYRNEGWIQRRFEIIKLATTDEKYEGANKWWTPNHVSTCIQISDNELTLANTLIFAPYFSTLLKKILPSPLSTNIDGTKNNIPNMSLNTILYGPPGTGKTFHSISYAVAIVEKKNPEGVIKEANTDRLEVKKRFDKYVDSGYIVFTTFHQSLSYEDFIEGIKPLPPEKDKNIKYDIVDGIFKNLCTRAESNWFSSNQPTLSKLTFEAIFEEFQEQWESNKQMKFSMRTVGKEFTIKGFSNKSIYFKKANGGEGHTLSINTLKDIYYEKRLPWDTGVGIYYPGIVEKLKIIAPTLKEIDSKLENYVIIIDEINRGNVSQIFGELITLIEDDKRIGSEESLTVTLPYSKDDFGVPPNLYIVGTMNTADRSIEALDTALRRRFSFIPKMPQENKLKITSDGIDLAALLLTINSRLKVLKDNDHTIGHAWLWGVSNLEQLKIVFDNKILPLLQEYFYSDYEKLGLVLGDAFFDIPHKRVDGNEFAAFTGSNGLSGQYRNKYIYKLKNVENLIVDDFLTLTQAPLEYED